MYAAFNTLQTELERLVLLKESIEQSGQAKHNIHKLNELDLKILSQQQATKVILREHFAQARRMLHNSRGLAVH